MNGSLSFVAELASGLSDHSSEIAQADIVICPPAIYLSELSQRLSESAGQPFMLGAQNIGAQDEGAYTGEISAGMLAEFDCSYVIVGHSERRALFSESSLMVAGKFQAAQRNGLTPILCVGESLEQRESNQTFEVLASQIEPLFELPVEVWNKAAALRT